MEGWSCKNTFRVPTLFWDTIKCPIQGSPILSHRPYRPESLSPPPHPHPWLSFPEDPPISVPFLKLQPVRFGLSSKPASYPPSACSHFRCTQRCCLTGVPCAASPEPALIPQLQAGHRSSTVPEAPAPGRRRVSFSILTPKFWGVRVLGPGTIFLVLDYVTPFQVC